MDGELRFEPSSLHLLMLPFQFTELLCDTVEPGHQLPCTDCATAERGMLVKDRTEMVTAVTDRTGLWDSENEILFKGASVDLSEASVQKSFKFLYGSSNKMAVNSTALCEALRTCHMNLNCENILTVKIHFWDKNMQVV